MFPRMNYSIEITIEIKYLIQYLKSKDNREIENI